MMETTRRECPMCGRELAEADGVWTCLEHGEWLSYGKRLLVRRPTLETKVVERVLLPWEQRQSFTA